MPSMALATGQLLAELLLDETTALRQTEFRGETGSIVVVIARSPIAEVVIEQLNALGRELSSEHPDKEGMSLN